MNIDAVDIIQKVQAGVHKHKELHPEYELECLMMHYKTADMAKREAIRKYKLDDSFPDPESLSYVDGVELIINFRGLLKQSKAIVMGTTLFYSTDAVTNMSIETITTELHAAIQDIEAKHIRDDAIGILKLSLGEYHG